MPVTFGGDPVEAMSETGRWRTRDVWYWSGRWEQLRSNPSPALNSPTSKRHLILLRIPICERLLDNLVQRRAAGSGWRRVEQLFPDSA